LTVTIEHLNLERLRNLESVNHQRHDTIDVGYMKQTESPYVYVVSCIGASSIWSVCGSKRVSCVVLYHSNITDINNGVYYRL